MEEKRYANALAQAREINLDSYAFIIAFECACFISPSDNYFEQFCSIVYDVYLDTYHISIDSICNALMYMLNDEDLDITTPLTNEQRELLIELACSYE